MKNSQTPFKTVTLITVGDAVQLFSVWISLYYSRCFGILRTLQHETSRVHFLEMLGCTNKNSRIKIIIAEVSSARMHCDLHRLCQTLSKTQTDKSVCSFVWSIVSVRGVHPVRGTKRDAS